MNQQNDCQIATTTTRAYRVHLYAVIRVPVNVPDALSQLDAIEKAEESVNLERDWKDGEYADEVVGVLVDEVGDGEYMNTRNYVADADSGKWVEERPQTNGAQQTVNPDGASIIELRQALRKLIDATASANTNKAMEARETAYAAYRNSLSPSERERVVKEAQSQQKSAPNGHFLNDLDPIESYDDALRTFGNSLIREVLGADA